MKTLATILLVSCWACGQDKAAVSAAEAACGPREVRFEVVTDESQHPTPAPEDGKALIYLVAEGSLTSVIGIDGKWTGAVNRGRYFFVSIDPGEHHLCAVLQKRTAGITRRISLHSLKAEPGGSYYFSTYLAAINALGNAYVLELEQLDPDEGRAFVARAKFSTSRPKNSPPALALKTARELPRDR